jgi:precorrin-8X/cobalt-precorrin-8 methylmutase
MHPHAIIAHSFALIDQEIGSHSWSESEYPIVRRAIHATADFELNHLFHFNPAAIASGIAALQAHTPVIVDVRMVAVAVASRLLQQQVPLFCALDFIPPTLPEGQTLTAAGMEQLIAQYPQAIFVIGNAPTALLSLTAAVEKGSCDPALVIGVPVGFVAVEEAKNSLARLSVPQIQVQGRKGGSPVAAAVLNALMEMAYPAS